MKPHLQVAEITTNAVYDETVEMGVDQENIGSILRSLTEMYTDAYLAVAREYISNSYDAMIESMGSESEFGTVLADPIEVTLPSRLNPSFIVRDYGIGMTREVLEKVFPMYGASTKRRTNAQIGGFGLGAKSAFAVVSSFVVTSIRDGKKNVVVFEKDENGVGHANFLAEQDTTDRNGTAVSISLPDPDRMNRIFRDSNLLLGFPHDSIRVNGTLMQKSVYSDKFLRVKHGWVTKSLIDWDTSSAQPSKVSNGYGEQVVIVGPITYTVPSNQLPDSDRWLGHYSVLNLPIGSVDLTPARDSLIYSERTKQAITTARVALKKELTELISQRVENAPDRAAALNIVQNLNTAQISHGKEWTYKGEVVPRRVIQFTKNVDKTFVSGSNGYRKNKVSVLSKHSSFSPERTLIVHSLDGVQETADKLNRYRKAFEKKHNNVNLNTMFIFTDRTLAELKELWFTDMVKEMFTADEFEKTGKAYRAEINAENRAARAANATSTRGVNAGSFPVSVLRQAGYVSECPSPVPTPARELVSAPRVVYIQQDENNTGTASHKAAFNSTTKDGGSTYLWRQLLNRAIAVLEWEISGTVVVRLGKNMKLDNFLAVLPNAISLDEALTNLAASDKMKKAPVEFFMPENMSTAWVDVVSVEDVNNPELKVWLETAKTCARMGNVERSALTHLGIMLDDENLTGFFGKTGESFREAFNRFASPMLAGIYYPRSMKEKGRQEIVEWLNHKYPVQD